MYWMLLGTKVHGYKQRALSDPWVPAQLWVIALVGSEGDYTFENANSRTLMDLTDSMRSIPDHILLEECQQYPDSQLPRRIRQVLSGRSGRVRARQAVS